MMRREEKLRGARELEGRRGKEGEGETRMGKAAEGEERGSGRGRERVFKREEELVYIEDYELEGRTMQWKRWGIDGEEEEN